MFAKCLKYEFQRLVFPFGVLYGGILVFAGVSRLTGLSRINPTEALFIFSMILGSIVILAYRFYRSMFTKEAAFLFSIPLSSVEQVSLRLISVLFFLTISSIIGTVTLLLLKGYLSEMILSMKLMTGVFLLFLVFCSIFGAVVQIELLFMITGLSVFRSHQIRWLILIGIAIDILNRTGTWLFRNSSVVMINFGIEGNVSISSQIPHVGISFPLPSLIWMIISIPVSIVLIFRLTKRQLMILA